MPCNVGTSQPCSFVNNHYMLDIHPVCYSSHYSSCVIQDPVQRPMLCHTMHQRGLIPLLKHTAGVLTGTLKFEIHYGNKLLF